MRQRQSAQVTKETGGGATVPNSSKSKKASAPTGHCPSSSASSKQMEFLQSLSDRFSKRQTPAKLAVFIQDPGLAVTGRIFCDVVIRMPIEGCCQDLVLGFAQSFGPVEYISCSGPSKQTLLEKSFATTTVHSGSVSDGDAASSDNNPQSGVTVVAASSPRSRNGDPYCHYLRFADARDAIRAVFELNGFVIDPEEEREEQTKAVHAVQQQLSAFRSQVQEMEEKKEGSGEPTPASDEAALWEELDAAIRDKDSHCRFVPSDEGARLVVMTCDFFRSSFLPNPAGSARCLLSKGSSGSTRRSSSAAPFDPVTQQQLWLRTSSRELMNVYGLVRSHGLEWDDFSFAVSYFSFFVDHGDSRVVARLQQRAAGRPAIAADGSPSPTPPAMPWLVVLEALRHVNYRTSAFLAWIDLCSTEAELLAGAKLDLIGAPALVQALALQRESRMRRGRVCGCWSAVVEMAFGSVLTILLLVAVIVLNWK
jgi:hypothetical protein